MRQAAASAQWPVAGRMTADAAGISATLTWLYDARDHGQQGDEAAGILRPVSIHGNPSLRGGVLGFGHG